MKDIIKREKEMTEEIKLLFERFRTIAQTRTNFQLEHFIVAQHDTPARQWWQCLLELKGQYFEMLRVGLAVEKIQIEIEKMKKKTIPDVKDWNIQKIEIKEKELELAQVEFDRIARLRECEALYAILQKIEFEANEGKPFTLEQINQGEAEYWHKRLTRQIVLGLNAGGGPGFGNLEAARQTLMEPGESAELGMPIEQVATMILALLPDDKKDKLLPKEPT